MKALLIAAGLILGMAAPAHAVGVDDTGKLTDGSWSLQFKVAPNFTLDEFGGNTISIKHHLAPRVALRAGLSVYLDDSDAVASFTEPDTTLDDRHYSDETRIYTLSFDLLYYPRPMAPVKLFLGVGPYIARHRQSNTQGASPSFISERDIKTYGVRAIGGVEWFFTDNFSLHAEYGIGLSWYSREDTRVTDWEDHESRRNDIRDGWSFRDAGVQFGLSVYL